MHSYHPNEKYEDLKRQDNLVEIQDKRFYPLSLRFLMCEVGGWMGVFSDSPQLTLVAQTSSPCSTCSYPTPSHTVRVTAETSNSTVLFEGTRRRNKTFLKSLAY